MARKKIVLYNPKSTPYSQRTMIAPLALLSICKLVDRKKFDVKIVVDSYYKDTRKILEGECKGAFLFGITALTGYQIIDGLEVSKMLRQKYPSLKVVWGGCHPTILPRQTIMNPLVDVVVKGQGERTFPELAEALSEGKSLRSVRGVLFKEKNKVVETEGREFEDINNFPRMPYELLDNLEDFISEYNSPNAKSKRAIPYISSYGCPFKCGFCCEHAVSGRRWFGLKPEKIAADIRWLVKKHGIDSVILYDNNFFVDKERIRELCKLLLKKGIMINWFNGDGRARELLKYDGELWQLMMKAGIRMILVGAESGLQEALDFMDKGLTVEETTALAKRASEMGMIISFSYIVGLPWSPDNREMQRKIDLETDATFSMIDGIMRTDRRHINQVYIYGPYEGTPLYAKSMEAGLKRPANLMEWGSIAIDKVSIPWITRRQVMKVYMYRYISFFLYPDSRQELERKVRRENKFLLPAFWLFFWVMKSAAWLRWRAKFFAIPIDYWLYRQAKKLFRVNELY